MLATALAGPGWAQGQPVSDDTAHASAVIDAMVRPFEIHYLQSMPAREILVGTVGRRSIRTDVGKRRAALVAQWREIADSQ